MGRPGARLRVSPRPRHTYIGDEWQDNGRWKTTEVFAIGMRIEWNRKARVTYGFDDIALVPRSVTINPTKRIRDSSLTRPQL